MSEVDVLAAGDDDVVVFHEQLVEPIHLTVYTPQLATTVTPSPTITAPLHTSSLPRPCDVTRARGNVLNIASVTSSSSFYESGTMSASVSRDHSPQRYPRPPPNMIISPAHCRSLSADRTSTSSRHNNSALQRLVKRLSDVIDIDDDVVGRCHDNDTELVRRRHGDQQQQAGGSDVNASRDLMTSLEGGGGHVSRKAASQLEISYPSSMTLPTTSSTSATNSKLSRWTATLALFRKKARRVDNRPPPTSSSSSSAAAAVAAASVSVVRPIQQQCASLSSGNVIIISFRFFQHQLHFTL